MTRNELIKELECAHQALPKLDLAIAFAIQWRPNEIDYPQSAASFAMHEKKHGYTAAFDHSSWRAEWHIPFYTASLDAARSISSWLLISLSDISAGGLPFAVLGDPSQSPPGQVSGCGATIELSLCIAGIKTK